MTSFEHITVLQNELLDSLALKDGDCAIDCTAGGGGHTRGLLDRVGPAGRVIAFDRDTRAIEVLKSRFQAELTNGRLILIQSPFSALLGEVERLGLIGKVQGLAADIGVSSPQIDEAERGFSFAKDGPLDMRMDQTQGLTAADIVNTWADHELSRLFRVYGEDPQANQIARAIAKRRDKKPFQTTLDLADLVAASTHYKERSRKHPATRVFQALRIEVNGELRELDALLKAIPNVLRPAGRCAIISFHSLEDRPIKNAFKDLAEGHMQGIDRRLPLTAKEIEGMKRFTIVKPFPIVPSDEEINRNPRSRSSKLRVIEKRPGESTA